MEGEGEHEFVTVRNRRWCVCCDMYQAKSGDERWQQPAIKCSRSTPYAEAKDELNAQLAKGVGGALPTGT